jgi:ketosteroid isomerase-like protein
LANFRTGRLRNTAYKVDEMQIRIYGTAAVVTYRSTVAGTSGLQDVAPQRRRTTVLIKRDGKWLIVAQQSTPILTIQTGSQHGR